SRSDRSPASTGTTRENHMMAQPPRNRTPARRVASRLAPLPLAAWVLAAAACSPSSSQSDVPRPVPTPVPTRESAEAPSPDPRVGLRAGLLDAGEAIWNLRLVS